MHTAVRLLDAPDEDTAEPGSLAAAAYRQTPTAASGVQQYDTKRLLLEAARVQHAEVHLALANPHSRQLRQLALQQSWPVQAHLALSVSPPLL